MNLKNQYKRLFESRVSSNDAKLLKEGTWSLGSPKHIGEMIKSLQAIIKMADDAQNRPNAAGRGFANALQNQLKDEGWNQRLYKILGDDSFHDAYDTAKTAAEVRDFDKVKIALGDAIGIAEKIKSYMEANIKR